MISRINESKRTVSICTVLIFLTMLFFALIDFVPGGYDILNVYRQSRAREEYILSERDKGNLELEVEIVKAETKYSAAYKLRYLKVGEWNDWPNVQMANYYRVNTIAGKK